MPASNSETGDGRRVTHELSSPFTMRDAVTAAVVGAVVILGTLKIAESVVDHSLPSIDPAEQPAQPTEPEPELAHD